MIKRIRWWPKSDSKNRIRLTKKLDANYNVADAAGKDESMFILTILEKIKETRLKFSQESVTVL